MILYTSFGKPVKLLLIRTRVHGEGVNGIYIYIYIYIIYEINDFVLKFWKTSEVAINSYMSPW